MTPIHALVFSKDRPMQLDAFLRSVQKYAQYKTTTILYSEPPFGPGEPGSGYGRVALDHKSGTWQTRKGPIQWRGELPGFENVVRGWVAQHERVVFHTDDELYYRTPPAELLANDQDVIMLRQGRNTTYCHPLDCEQQIPAGFPRWRWQDAEHDFGYPLSLNSTIYQAAWIAPLLNFHFNNPTQLEAGLACQYATFAPEFAVAPEHSCTVSLPHNVVSVDSGCPRGGNPEWQPEALTAKYLEGWRIDLDAMDFSDVTAAHQEIPLEFYKP